MRSSSTATPAKGTGTRDRPSQEGHKRFHSFQQQDNRENLRRFPVYPRTSTAIMPIVSYSYSGPSEGVLALELLAKLQDTELTVNATADAKPTLTVATTNPIVGSSTTSSSESWAGCAKTLSNLIPSLGFWYDGDGRFEQWIGSAASILGMCRAVAA